MKILSIDPGIVNLGWIVLDTETREIMFHGIQALVPFSIKPTEAEVLDGIGFWIERMAQVSEMVDIILIERPYMQFGRKAIEPISYNAKLLCYIAGAIYATHFRKARFVEPMTVLRFLRNRVGEKKINKKKVAKAILSADHPGIGELYKEPHVADCYVNALCWHWPSQ